MGKKYLTDEERKAAHRETMKRYYQKHKDEIAAYRAAHKAERAEYDAKYYQEHKDKKAEYDAKYRQSNKEKIAKYQVEYRSSHKEIIAEKNKLWYQNNKEKIAEHRKEYGKKWYQDNKEKRSAQIEKYNKNYVKTPIGRAVQLLSRYKYEDKKNNRGECTLTAKWIVKNIFSQPCVHCGKEGWEVIGCNRLDNSKPHTKDNVEPCCFDCNRKISGGRPKNGGN